MTAEQQRAELSKFIEAISTDAMMRSHYIAIRIEDGSIDPASFEANTFDAVRRALGVMIKTHEDFAKLAQLVSRAPEPPPMKIAN